MENVFEEKDFLPCVYPVAIINGRLDIIKYLDSMEVERFPYALDLAIDFSNAEITDYINKTNVNGMFSEMIGDNCNINIDIIKMIFNYEDYSYVYPEYIKDGRLEYIRYLDSIGVTRPINSLQIAIESENTSVLKYLENL